MTRTQMIVERNKRRKEIRENVCFVIFITVMVLMGVIPFSMKIQEIRSDNADTQYSDVEYIRVIDAEELEHGE